MVASSSPPINLSFHLPACHQKAFVPFRFFAVFAGRILFPVNIALLSTRFNIVYLTAAIMVAFFLPPPISGFGNWCPLGYGGIEGGSELNGIEIFYSIQSRAFPGKRS